VPELKLYRVEFHMEVMLLSSKEPTKFEAIEAVREEIRASGVDDGHVEVMFVHGLAGVPAVWRGARPRLREGDEEAAGLTCEQLLEAAKGNPNA
jgi:hypothetical protein